MAHVNDGTNTPRPGGGESGGGKWPGKNDKPAHPDEGVVTNVVRETADAKEQPVKKNN